MRCDECGRNYSPDEIRVEGGSAICEECYVDEWLGFHTSDVPDGARWDGDPYRCAHCETALYPDDPVYCTDRGYLLCEDCARAVAFREWDDMDVPEIEEDQEVPIPGPKNPIGPIRNSDSTPNVSIAEGGHAA